MGGTATASGSAKTGKVNDVVEDANWRQRINAETEAAECWRHEWGFLLSQNGADAGLDNSFTERARAKMKEMEAVQAARDEEMDASAAAEKANELFLKTFKKKHKAFPKCVHRVSQRAHSHVIFSLSPPFSTCGCCAEEENIDVVGTTSMGKARIYEPVTQVLTMSSLSMRHTQKKRETRSFHPSKPQIRMYVCCPTTNPHTCTYCLRSNSGAGRSHSSSFLVRCLHRMNMAGTEVHSSDSGA